MKTFKESRITYDICLVFPPLTWLDLWCLPAGIPSLVGYLKRHNYNPFVLDLDLYYKNSFLLYKILNFTKSSLNALAVKCKEPAIDKDKKKRFRYLVKKVGVSIIYKIIFNIRKFFFDDEITLPFNQVLELSKKHILSYGKIERRLLPALENTIKDQRILGISIIFPSQILYALIIAKLAKEINRDLRIILGGAQITLFINDFINNATIFNYIDGFIVHEGEMALKILLDGKPQDQIPNFYYKENDGYRPSKSLGFVMPINEYETPDFEGFDLKSYPKGILPIRTLRGCFWGKCRFCAYSYVSGEFRLSDAKLVVNTIKMLTEKYRVTKFEFIDSSVPANYLKHIAEEIIRNNLKIRWYCRANYQEDFKNMEFVRQLKKSGCESLIMGLEAGSDRVIQYMRKMQKDIESVREIARILWSEDIRSVLYVMLGFPTETKAEMEKTIDLVMELKSKFRAIVAPILVFNLLEHTYVYNHPEEFKILKISVEKYNKAHGYGHDFVCMEGASRKDAYCMAGKANLFIRSPFLYKITKLLNI